VASRMILFGAMPASFAAACATLSAAGTVTMIFDLLAWRT
jgi:hypothetical protein